MKILFAVFTLAVLVPIRAIAWSSAGHEVVAAIAWRELPAHTKAKVFDLLKSHPDFAKWQNSFRGEAGSADLPTYVFLRASRWPDEIRRGRNPYDHPHWHYVDWALKPPSFDVGSEPNPTDNVIYGLAQCERVLADSKASPQERAVHLSWLIHLCGDVAQPLHCVSYFGDRFPNGDKGGNGYYVKPGNRGISLHSLWDGLLGTSGSPQAHVKEAAGIAAQYPRSALPEIQQHRTPKEWSLEGRTLAMEKAYLRDTLRGSANSQTAPELPSGYTKYAKTIAEKQAAKAGYRLFDEIQQALK